MRTVAEVECSAYGECSASSALHPEVQSTRRVWECSLRSPDLREKCRAQSTRPEHSIGPSALHSNAPLCRALDHWNWGLGHSRSAPPCCHADGLATVRQPTRATIERT